MSDHIQQLVGLITAIIIFWRAEGIINQMSKECIMLIRLAFWLMVVGSFGMTIIIMQGYVPPVMVLLMTAGLALLLITERRITIILRRHGAFSSYNDRRTP